MLDQRHHRIRLPFCLVLGQLLDANGNQVCRIVGGSWNGHTHWFGRAADRYSGRLLSGSYGAIAIGSTVSIAVPVTRLAVAVIAV